MSEKQKYFLILNVFMLLTSCASEKTIAKAGSLEIESVASDSFTNDTLVYWSKSYQLDSLDFEGKVDRSDSLKPAHLEGKIIISHVLFEDSIVFTIRSAMHKPKSWLYGQDKASLGYARVLFDLLEVRARMMRIACANAVSYDLELTFNELESNVNSTHRSMDSIQQIYNEQTNFGHLRRQQRIWKRGINKQIRFLDHFSSTVVIVPREEI